MKSRSIYILTAFGFFGAVLYLIASSKKSDGFVNLQAQAGRSSLATIKNTVSRGSHSGEGVEKTEAYESQSLKSLSFERSSNSDEFLERFSNLETQVLKSGDNQLVWKELLTSDDNIESAIQALDASLTEETRFAAVRFLAEAMALKATSERLDFFHKLVGLFEIPIPAQSLTLVERKSVLADRLELFSRVRFKIVGADELLLQSNSNATRFIELAKKWSQYRFGTSS